jgi:hypothetical protein
VFEGQSGWLQLAGGRRRTDLALRLLEGRHRDDPFYCTVRPPRALASSVSMVGGGFACCWPDHPGRCHGAVLADGLHGGGFDVGASLLASPCEVWNLVGCGV